VGAGNNLEGIANLKGCPGNGHRRGGLPHQKEQEGGGEGDVGKEEGEQGGKRRAKEGGRAGGLMGREGEGTRRGRAEGTLNPQRFTSCLVWHHRKSADTR